MACATTCDSKFNSTLITPAKSLYLIAITGGSECFCLNRTTDFLNHFYVEDVAQCPNRCSDGLSCGGQINARFSIYALIKKSDIKIEQSPTVKKNPPAIPSPVVKNVADGAVDFTKGQEALWFLIGGATIAVAVLSALLYVFLKRRGAQNKLQTLPRLQPRGQTPTSARSHSSLILGSVDEIYLLPNTLPATPNLIYNVVSRYISRNGDEINLNQDDVVAIKQSFKDRWALGTNISTGISGFFPMDCLVDKSGSYAANVYERVDSKIHSNQISQERFNSNYPPHPAPSVPSNARTA